MGGCLGGNPVPGWVSVLESRAYCIARWQQRPCLNNYVECVNEEKGILKLSSVVISHSP